MTIPPAPNCAHIYSTAVPGQFAQLNIYQRIEMKLDHLIDCIHAVYDGHAPSGLCPECFWDHSFGVVCGPAEEAT